MYIGIPNGSQLLAYLLKAGGLYMAYTYGEAIRAADIFARFQSEVINKILSTSYQHLTNPGKVPTEYLDYANIISVDAGYNIGGYKNQPIVANDGNIVGSIYGGLVYLSKLLLKLGSYDYHEYKTGVYDTHTTGKCMFSNYAVMQAFGVLDMSSIPLSPDTSGVIKNLGLNLSSFNALMQSCYQSVVGSQKVFLQIEDGRCHSDCHEKWSDGHSNNAISPPCNNGDVYQNGPWAYKPGTPQFPDPGYHANSPASETNSGRDSNTCHDNDASLSLRYETCNSSTICNTGFIIPDDWVHIGGE